MTEKIYAINVGLLTVPMLTRLWLALFMLAITKAGPDIHKH